MDLHEALEYARRATHIVRERKNPLFTFGATRLPYVCLSESQRKRGRVVVRRGEVAAERPLIALPGQPFSFEGFEFEEDEQEILTRVLLARRIEMPRLKYTNKAAAARIEGGPLDAAIERAVNGLDQANDSRTAVISTPERVWNLSILVYVGAQIVRSAPANVAEHLERIELRGRG